MKYYLDDTEIPTLESALAGCTADDLRRLASLTGEKPPTRKADIAAAIIRHLQGDRLRTVWQGLDELQQAAVAEVVHAGSARFDAARFRAKYGKDPHWGSEDRYGCDRQPSPLRFFFYGSVMPADLKARLKTFVGEPRPMEIAVVEQLPPNYDRPFERWIPEQRSREKGTKPVPLSVRETERAASRELLSVLRLVDAGKVAVSDKTRRATASTIEAVTALLDGGDYYPYVPTRSKWDDENAGPIRAFAWPLLIQAAGLAQLSGRRLQLTKAGRKALSEPAPAAIRTLWNKWMDTTMFDELARIDCVKGQNGKGKRGLTAASSRREAIAESLAECPAGRWIATDDFIRYMRATGNDLEVSRDPWGLYVSDQQYGSLGYEGYAGVLNERYAFALLLEYAATLGIIDVALIPPAGARRDFRKLWGTDDLPFFSRYDGLMYFRITPLGAWCLGIGSDCQPAPEEVKPVLRVLPNLEVAAAGPGLEQSDRLALNAWTVPVSDFVWRLEAGKLLAAIEEGRPVEELREFLTARSGAAIPDTVARLLDDVGERCTKLHDRGLARLIECADSALAALIANDTRTRKHCLRAGERHLVVPASSEAAFRRGLRDAGYLLSTGVTRPRAAGV
jgi:hypothetical protein